MPRQPPTFSGHGKLARREVLEYARRVTRVNPDVQILRPDLMDRYAPIAHVLQNPFINALKRGELVLPNLHAPDNETVAIYSDYSGESVGPYLTYSFLVCGWNDSFGVYPELRRVREKYGLGQKEITFKDLRFGPAQRSLRDYLKALDFCVPGLLYPLVVEKRIITLFGEQSRDTSAYLMQVLRDSGFGEWKANVVEKLLRATHTAAFLTALLSRAGQKVFWMSDHDAICPTPAVHQRTLEVFASLLDLYAPHQFEMIGGATPFQERSTDVLDLLSATDLAAGALAQYLARLDEVSGVHDDITVKKGADTVLMWLGHHGVALKMIVIARLTAGGDLNSAEFQLIPTEIPEDVVFVPL